uniref:Uncharacterized protein n=1 Tax=Acrobeloides nanus TaxID=290746 RepID=A0A914CAY7_9BILA
MSFPYKNLIEERESIVTEDDLAKVKGLPRINFFHRNEDLKTQLNSSETKFCINQCSLICRAVLLLASLICIIFLIFCFIKADNHNHTRPIYPPVVRGPAKSPRFPLCSGIQYLDCGYSWDEQSVLARHQENVDKIIASFLASDNEKSDLQKASPAIQQAKLAFKTCMREASGHIYNGTEVLNLITRVLKEMKIPAPMFGL